MDSVKTHSEPGEVNAEQGQVPIEVPDGAAATMTPDAAGISAASQPGRRQAH